MATKKDKNLAEVLEDASNPEVPEGTEAVEGGEETASGTKRTAKMTRDYDSSEGIFKVSITGGKKGEQIFDAKTLPENIQAMLPAFALNHKLGDSTSGVRGVDAEEAIDKTWAAMMAGTWEVKIAKGPSVKASEVKAGYEALPDAIKAQALDLLKALGLKIPGVTD
jgi:hypothetical protein